MTTGSRYRDLKIIVRRNGDMATLNLQKINNPEKYLVGKYDLEIPVLPRIYINDLEIKQSTTTKIKIPTPGIVNFLMTKEGFCSIYTLKKQELEWIYNMPLGINHETLIMQPGTYKVIYRPKYAKRSYYTIGKSFVVKPGSSQSIKLF